MRIRRIELYRNTISYFDKGTEKFVLEIILKGSKEELEDIQKRVMDE